MLLDVPTLLALLGSEESALLETPALLDPAETLEAADETLLEPLLTFPDDEEPPPHPDSTIAANTAPVTALSTRDIILRSSKTVLTPL